MIERVYTLSKMALANFGAYNSALIIHEFPLIGFSDAISTLYQLAAPLSDAVPYLRISVFSSREIALPS